MLVVGAAMASAYSFKVDGLCYDISYPGKVAVTYEVESSTRYNTLGGDLHIPESVDYGGETYEVTAIGSKAFMGCNGLTSVTIPNTVTSIESYALWGCNGLMSVTIGSRVASIGEYALSDCRNLTSLAVAVNNPNYDSREGCNAIIETATNKLVAGCQTTTIPNGVTAIGFAAFRGSTGMTALTIPESVTAIDARAFERCTALSSVDFPASLTTIGDYAFKGCSGLTSVDFATSLTTIGVEAFRGCTGLTKLVIPVSMRKIGEAAFLGCTGLTTLTIDNAAVTILYDAFNGCSSLSTIDFGDALITIYPYAFAFTPWLDNQPDGLVYAGKVACQYKGVMPLDTKIEVKEGTIGINIMCFKDCAGLTSVSIPESVISIGQFAFSACSGLTSVTIPESVTFIDIYPFFACTGLSSVIWNAANCQDFSSLADAPFVNLSGIQSIEFGDKVKRIPSYLCYGMAGLTALTIPESVTAIGSKAFEECRSLEHVSSYPRCEDIVMGIKVFGAGSTDGCTLHVRPSSTTQYRHAAQWKEFNNIVGDLEDPLDINADGLINVGDVNVLLVEILAHPAGNGDTRYDVNGDGEVNVGDVNEVLDAILRIGR